MVVVVINRTWVVGGGGDGEEGVERKKGVKGLRWTT